MTEKIVMTEDEALELVGDAVTNKFVYYKYSVTYTLDTDEFSASLSFGGESDDVYRFELTESSSRSIKEWIGYECECRIVRKSDGAVFEIEGHW